MEKSLNQNKIEIEKDFFAKANEWINGLPDEKERTLQKQGIKTLFDYFN